MQGFVLEGYPQTEGQVVALKDIYIQPSLIVTLDNGSNIISEVSKIINEKYQSIILKINVGVN
jgi:hypothetical protein